MLDLEKELENKKVRLTRDEEPLDHEYLQKKVGKTQYTFFADASKELLYFIIAGKVYELKPGSINLDPLKEKIKNETATDDDGIIQQDYLWFYKGSKIKSIYRWLDWLNRKIQ